MREGKQNLGFLETFYFFKKQKINLKFKSFIKKKKERQNVSKENAGFQQTRFFSCKSIIQRFKQWYVYF